MANPKLCECGCGEVTPLATRSSPKRGYAKGEHVRFAVGHRRRRERTWTVEDRGHETPCWIWGGLLTEKGYGRDYFQGKWRRAHVVLYEQHVATVSDGLRLDHLCRVRDCVNPAHLEPVTNAENLRRGDKTKLSHADVEAIRRSSASSALLAARYGVTRDHVTDVRSGRAWRDTVSR